MANQMISYCGLTCTECDAFIATQTGDEAKAKATAAMWAKEFNASITVDDVWCDGCLVEGKKCTHCGECKIRACAREKGVENCAHCADYACAVVGEIHGMVPAAKEALDRIRDGL